ncbi:tRNA (adenosine(37)-N6)-threonylcarbamoyltransferase complex ATPase subunit type 1 TsaE [Candidatus Daviesbacteria bacterium]|nr:tRNA (adenosine(37)-N6)-threonylcarbamoyltransferase complex ATPase subunit type 1 TsaE [Candidatus Daviesbacteria bacterium]
MHKLISRSEKETKQLAAKFAKEFKAGVIALSGQLGTGKTTFVQGFARGLGIKEKILSPTFVYIRQHQIPKTDNTLYHIDLYRLESEEEIKNLGLEEIMNNSNNTVIIEWAQKVKNILPNNTTWIYLETVNENQRKIIVS